MKKRIVTNALCSWAEAVALSAGEDIDLCRRTCSEATIEVFQNIRQVSKHALACIATVQSALSPNLSARCGAFAEAHQQCLYAI